MVKTKIEKTKVKKIAKPQEKLNVQVAFMITEKVSSKLEKLGKKLKMKSKSDLLRLILDEKLSNIKASA